MKHSHSARGSILLYWPCHPTAEIWAPREHSYLPLGNITGGTKTQRYSAKAYAISIREDKYI